MLQNTTNPLQLSSIYLFIYLSIYLSSIGIESILLFIGLKFIIVFFLVAKLPYIQLVEGA